MHTQAMSRSHPSAPAGAQAAAGDALIRCIEACYDCAQACTACADACLGEAMVTALVQCIRLDLDCADVCAATGRVASRRTGTDEIVLKRMLVACADACRLCAEECERHADQHAHCRICAEACRDCEQACRAATSAISPRMQ